MKNKAPISEGGLSSAWANWFNSADLCIPWVKAFTAKATLDFPNINALSQQSLSVTVKGARPGDGVSVTPGSDVAGVIFAGVVTAADTVTVYAKNYSAGAVNPASQDFRIIVIQN